ncbi:glycosyltransferase family 2 protein [Streptomyces sp. NPDC017936]|uniref:glycosyltransferase family 2 protein n=1 Tax=Streptomyces sp. NPDC017936 TaxID=3365016 RepID=UPI0037A56B95
MDVAATAPPRISLCVLNHNYAHYLGRAVESCLAQEPGAYHLQEIVVLDDGSTDGSLDVCARYGDRVRVVALPHGGFGATLSEAVRRCTGDWVAFLDADDWFAPDKLRVAAAGLRPGVRFLQHWEYVVDGAGEALVPEPHPGGNTSTLLVHRASALSLLPVTNEKFFHVLDDLGLGARLPEPLTHYRVHASNMTDRATPGSHQDYMAGVCRALSARLTELAAAPPDWASAHALRRLALHYRAEAHAHTVEAALQRGRRPAAWRPLLAELLLTARAGRGWRSRLPSVRSVLTGRPCVRLAPAAGEGAS